MGEYKKTKKRTISKFLEIVKNLNFFVSDATNLKISYKVKSQFFSGVYQSLTWQNGRIGQFLVVSSDIIYRSHIWSKVAPGAPGDVWEHFEKNF